MVIVGHMSSKSTFGAKNTGQKFLTPKNFWWCRNVCPDSCPGVIFGAGRGSALFFRGGAGQSWKFSGPGRPGAAISPGAGAGRGGACIPAFHRSLRGCVLKAWRENKPTWKNTLSEQKVVFTPYSKGAFTNGVMLSETESNWILCTQQSTGFKSARTSYCVHLQKFRFCTVCPSFPFWNQKVLSFLPYSPNSLPCSPCPVSTCSFNKVIFRAPF